MKRLFKQCIAVILVIMIINVNAYAENISYEEQIREFIYQISQDVCTYENMIDFDEIVSEELCNIEGETKYMLCKLMDSDEYLGYVIWDIEQELVCEISDGLSPYDSYLLENECDYDDYIMLYVNGNYGLESYSEVVWMNESGKAYCAIDNRSSSTYGLILGVRPQLQNSSHSIATALANVLYYWSNHGYSNLAYIGSFDALKSEIQSLFNNNIVIGSIPSVAETYCRRLGYSVVSQVYWSPQLSVLLNEIDAGRPCMLGFDAGSPYGATAGHMTMCCGYSYTSGYCYVNLADGLTTSIVSKIWSASYNDCIITIAMQ